MPSASTATGRARSIVGAEVPGRRGSPGRPGRPPCTTATPGRSPSTRAGEGDRARLDVDVDHPGVGGDLVDGPHRRDARAEVDELVEPRAARCADDGAGERPQVPAEPGQAGEDVEGRLDELAVDEGVRLAAEQEVERTGHVGDAVVGRPSAVLVHRAASCPTGAGSRGGGHDRGRGDPHRPHRGRPRGPVRRSGGRGPLARAVHRRPDLGPRLGPRRPGPQRVLVQRERDVGGLRLGPRQRRAVAGDRPAERHPRRDRLDRRRVDLVVRRHRRRRVRHLGARAVRRRGRRPGRARAPSAATRRGSTSARRPPRSAGPPTTAPCWPCGSGTPTCGRSTRTPRTPASGPSRATSRCSRSPTPSTATPATRRSGCCTVADGSAVADLYDGEGKGLDPVEFAPVAGDSRLLVAHERRGRDELLIWDPVTGTETELDIDLPGDVSAGFYPDARALIVAHTRAGRTSLHRYDLGAGHADRPAHRGRLGRRRGRPARRLGGVRLVLGRAAVLGAGAAPRRHRRGAADPARRPPRPVGPARRRLGARPRRRRARPLRAPRGHRGPGPDAVHDPRRPPGGRRGPLLRRARGVARRGLRRGARELPRVVGLRLGLARRDRGPAGHHRAGGPRGRPGLGRRVGAGRSAGVRARGLVVGRVPHAARSRGPAGALGGRGRGRARGRLRRGLRGRDGAAARLRPVAVRRLPHRGARPLPDRVAR